MTVNEWGGLSSRHVVQLYVSGMAFLRAVLNCIPAAIKVGQNDFQSPIQNECLRSVSMKYHAAFLVFTSAFQIAGRDQKSRIGV